MKISKSERSQCVSFFFLTHCLDLKFCLMSSVKFHIFLWVFSVMYYLYMSIILMASWMASSVISSSQKNREHVSEETSALCTLGEGWGTYEASHLHTGTELEPHCVLTSVSLLIFIWSRLVLPSFFNRFLCSFNWLYTNIHNLNIVLNYLKTIFEGDIISVNSIQKICVQLCFFQWRVCHKLNKQNNMKQSLL